MRICRLRVLRQPSSNDRVRKRAMKSGLLPYLRDPSRIKDSDPTERILQICSAGRIWQNTAENAVIPPDSVIQYQKRRTIVSRRRCLHGNPLKYPPKRLLGVFGHLSLLPGPLDGVWQTEMEAALDGLDPRSALRRPGTVHPAPP